MRLLLAEDEKELSGALKVILEHSNYSVDVVDNGIDAWDYLQADNYDGAILDVMMPGMDGITVLTKLRERGSTLPVLILTAKAEIDDRVLGLDSGADDYLTKPFATKELLARIRSITRRQKEAKDVHLRLGNLALNQANFTLESASGSVRLPNKEYQMLELFLSNPGQVISAERLLERIWGYDSDAELGVVWVYISSLRKRLSSLDANVQIKSIRNQGYLLEVVE